MTTSTCRGRRASGTVRAISQRDLPGDGKAFDERNRAGREALGECRARDELHDQRAGAVALFEAEDRGDVGVMQLREQPRLAFEPPEPLLVVGEGRRKDFYGDVTIEPRVGGAPDLPHSAFADKVEDLVRAKACAGSKRHEVWGLYGPSCGDPLAVTLRTFDPSLIQEDAGLDTETDGNTGLAR